MLTSPHRFTPPNPTSPHLTSLHPTPPHLTILPLTSPHLTDHLTSNFMKLLSSTVFRNLSRTIRTPLILIYGCLIFFTYFHIVTVIFVLWKSFTAVFTLLTPPNFEIFFDTLFFCCVGPNFLIYSN